jgi:hypothetical protein
METLIEFNQPVDPALRTIEIASLRIGSKPGNPSVKLDIPDKLKLLADGAHPYQGQGCFRFMTPKDGDKRIVWDAHDLEQIAEAKRMFDEAIQQGLVPYKVGVDGRATSEVMEEFDPEAEEVIFLPVALVCGG